MESNSETLPMVTGEQLEHEGAPVIVESHVRDEKTGATYVHKDLVERVKPWENEAHVGPVNETIALGDIESFAAYVAAYSGFEPGNADKDERETLVTWNNSHLHAVLDYHTVTPGRCGWVVEHRFARSREWLAWASLCAGALTQQQAVEKLEDLADGILEPPPADFMAILRGLRANVRREAVSEYLENGDTKFSFRAEASVQSTTRGEGVSTVTLPSEIRIRIPVLLGHTQPAADRDVLVPVVYDLDVKVRAAVDENSHVTLRFSIPKADKVLDEVIAERVAAAKELLGEAFTVYRAAE